MTSLELKEQRNQLLTESRTWLEKAESEGRATSEVDAEWEKRMIAIDKLEAEISKLQKREVLEAKESDLRQSTGRRSTPTINPTAERQLTKQERNEAIKAWAGAGLKGVRYDNEVAANASRMGLGLHQNNVEWRTGLVTTTNSAGGYSTFSTTIPDVQAQLKYYSDILGKVKVYSTTDGNSFTIPRASDISNSVSIVSQAGTGSESDPTFDKVTLTSYMYRTIVTVSYEMLEDAVYDIEQFVNEELGIRFARTLENAIVAGSGSSAPTGLIAACVAADGGTPAVTLASGGTHYSFYTFNDLFTLFQAVDLAYRPNCTLIVNDAQVWAMRKITDGNSRYIWDINNTLVQNSQPDKIAGFNYLVSNAMPAGGTSTQSTIGVFADLSRMVVRMVDGIQLRRLNELYAASGFIGIEARMRFDCNYVGHATSIARAYTPAS